MTIAHIFNGELGFDVRTKLNDLIDLSEGNSTILSGSGAPSTGLGSVGDYYVDEDGNQMYGPKLAPGSFGTDQIAIPPATTPTGSGSGSFEVGAYVLSAVAGEIYAIRYWREAATTQIARTVNVWTTGGALLSSGSVANDGGGSGWKQITLTTPVAVSASGTVVVSVDITNTFAQTVSPGFPISNGGDISITSASYSTTPGTFPNNAFGNNFFVDAVFHVALPVWSITIDGDAMPIGAPVAGGTSGSILYVDASTNLAQQNANFFWDDPNNALKIGTGHTYNIDTFRALYRVANVSGDNWFEGDAGNPTTTGHDNFGTGSGCLNGVTTGFGNTGVGTGCMTYLTTGVNNFGFGTNTLRSIGAGSYNVAIGPSAMQSSVDVSTNVAIGIGPLNALTGSSSSRNIAIGSSALGALVSGSGNIGIGDEAGQNITGDAGYIGNIFIGAQAASGVVGTNVQNTIIGARAAWAASSLTCCTVLGVWKGPSMALSNVIAINDGAGEFFGINQAALDWNYTNNGIWSFHRLTTAQGLHVYNSFDDVVPTVNYERAIFDWRAASNVLTIGTQAGGTGTKRLTAIDGFAKAGAPAAGDLPANSFSVIDDTSAGQTWLVFNKAGTIRKVQLT